MAWSILFFGLKSPLLGFLDICLLWVATGVTVTQFFLVSRPAGWLMMPYWAWLTVRRAQRGDRASGWLSRAVSDRPRVPLGIEPELRAVSFGPPGLFPRARKPGLESDLRPGPAGSVSWFVRWCWVSRGEMVRGAAGRVVGGVEFRDLLAMINSPNGSRQKSARVLIPSNSNAVRVCR